MREQYFNGGGRSTSPLCVMIDNIFSLFESARSLAVEAPKQGVQNGRLAHSIFRVDYRNVLVFLGGEADLALTKETAKILQADFFKNHVTLPRSARGVRSAHALCVGAPS